MEQANGLLWLMGHECGLVTYSVLETAVQWSKLWPALTHVENVEGFNCCIADKGYSCPQVSGDYWLCNVLDSSLCTQP